MSSAARAAAGGVQEGIKEIARGGVVAHQFLGMPLHRDGERVPRNLGALGGAVVGVSHDAEASPGTVDRLVVEAVDVESCAAQDFGESRSRLDLHGVAGDVASALLAVLDQGADGGGDVLDEGASEGDIQD